jgi:anti-sigma B factor antagonist
MRDDGFPVEVADGVLVVAAPEAIDITNADALRSALLTAAESGPGPLVVDMTRTRFCDSSGLHALIAVHKRAGARGCEVLLVIPSVAVLRVFALTGMGHGDPPRHQPDRGPSANGRRQCRWTRTRSLSKIITRPSPAAIEVAARSFQP